MNDAGDLRIEQLTHLGLTRYEAAAYLALLGRQGFTPAQAAAQAGIPRQRIYDVLDSLAARGLCTERHQGQRSYHAVDPQVALPALLADQQRQRDAEAARQQQSASSLLEQIGPLFHHGSAVADPLDYVDVLLEQRHVAARAVALAQQAQHDICVCFRRPLIASLEENIAEVREPLLRGVRYRAIYERALLDDPTLLPYVKQFIEWGQQARVVDELPMKMNLFDRRITLLSLQDPVTGTLSFTALCIAHPHFTHMLSLAFEGLWAQGEPLSPALFT